MATKGTRRSRKRILDPTTRANTIRQPDAAFSDPPRYVWRDPARVSAVRLAELEAHDARLRAQGAEAGSFTPTVPDSEPPVPGRAEPPLPR